MANQQREIQRFTARDTSGKIREIIVHQEFVDASSRAGRSWLPGMKEMKTIDGIHVNYISKGKYQALDPWGKTDLQSDDPGAP